ncbi:hypothetical protein B0H13DRAFT_2265716 [Mycena leptocephala]|nr:hypothetical protein B0H13DRAFT_2265716 [Mycena leptocephala]
MASNVTMASNFTMASNTPCSLTQGPLMNTDISGIGVRVSFYLQTLFLSCLCARSGSPDEIAAALYTLVFTNTAMAVTALILGFKPDAEISFHDALVVFYLLNLSWVTVFFSLPACAKFANVKLLHIFSILQSYTVFAFALTMLITAHTFGSNPQCNQFARIVIFRPFLALPAGRIVCLVLEAVLVVGYTGILVKDHIPPAPKMIFRWIQKRVTREVPAADADSEGDGLPMRRPEAPPPRRPQGRYRPQQVSYHSRKAPVIPKEYDLQIAWNIVIELAFVLALWGLTVMNTELLIRWNHIAPEGGQASSWQFGQVLPMFLVVLPLSNLVTAFRDYGLRPLPTNVAMPKA